MNEDKKIDYLEVDQNISGQNYVCMSFLSPESFIQNREAFNTAKFLQSYCKDQKLKFDDLYSKYKDFTYKHEDQLQRDFDESNDFQTSMRGIKIRGVFDTRQEAESRAKKLSTTDSSFHVFIGQVGYWLPWDPNADKISDEVFQNTQLNDMMEKYQENNVNRDIFYEEQKREKVKAAREEAINAKKKKAEDEEEEKRAEEKVKEIENVNYGSEPEPETKGDPEPEPETKADPEPEPDNAEEIKAGGDIPTSDNKLDKDLTDSLETDDPWMQQKLKQ